MRGGGWEYHDIFNEIVVSGVERGIVDDDDLEVVVCLCLDRLDRQHQHVEPDGIRVWGSEFGVWDRVEDSVFGVWGAGFGVWG